MRRFLGSIAAGAGIVIAASFATAQMPHFNTYRDPRYGVTFVYPTNWSAGPNLDSFYLMTDILQPIPGSDTSVTRYEQALMKVGFRNAGKVDYERTNLDGVEFVYFVLPNATSDACYTRIRSLADASQGDHSPTNIAIHGVTYLHLSTGDAGLGHGASRELYAAYLGSRCYLFEEGIHSYNGGDGKFLTSKQYLTLKAQLGAVMHSVRIAPSTSR
jgi:hypothetical protein